MPFTNIYQLKGQPVPYPAGWDRDAQIPSGGRVKTGYKDAAMPSLIRFVGRKINAIAGNHFCAPRRRAELRLKVAMVEARAHSHRAPITTFDGYTRDISSTGVAILLPIARFSDELLNQSRRTLRIVLELANGAIEADAALVRYEPVTSNDGRTKMGFLIGAQILNMREDHRERFDQHLRSIN